MVVLCWHGAVSVCLSVAACNCDVHGSYGVSCDEQTGECDCRPTFDGLTCNKCKPNFYNYPICEGLSSTHTLLLFQLTSRVTTTATPI